MNRQGLFISALAFSVMVLSAAVGYAMSDFDLTLKGDAAMTSCNYGDAIMDYQQALQSAPNNGSLIVKLAEAYEGSQWYGRSVQLWESYLKLYPSGGQADIARRHAAMNHRWIGSELFLIGGAAESSAFHLRRAINLNTDQMDAYPWLARVDISEARYSESINVLNMGTLFGPETEEYAWLRKEAMSGIRREGPARAAIERGIRLYDDDHPASALRSFRTAGILNPNASIVHYWKGRSYMAMGRYAAAAGEFRKFDRSDRSNFRFAWLLEQAQQNAGAPLKRIAFYRELPSLSFPSSPVAVASESRPIGAPGPMLVCRPAQ